MMRIILLLVSACAIHIHVLAQVFTNTEKPNTPQDWVMAKNYFSIYLLFKNHTVASDVLKHDVAFRDLMKTKKVEVSESKGCDDPVCFVEKFKWTNAEIDIIVNAVLNCYKSNEILQKLVKQQLITSYKYGSAESISATDYLRKALEQDFKAMNYTIDVYASGKKPNYPRIDSISFDINKRNYLSTLKDVKQDVLKDMNREEDFMFLSLLSSIRFLEINERWDAALLEPLVSTENQKAVEKIKQLDWSNYSYASLLVLGAGPDQHHQPISPGGMLRCRMAARTYYSGLTPFIIVSGGRVHPYKTRYIEAIEMKRYLIEIHRIPEDAIIIDPHARHTTTNLRNASRLLFEYGFPLDKKSIVGSSEVHIDAVERMADRCKKELGYVPYSLGKRLSDVLLEFKPSKESLIIDWDEPLDP